MFVLKLFERINAIRMPFQIGAILSTIPEALVGAILASSMTVVCGVAVQNLRLVR